VATRGPNLLGIDMIDIAKLKDLIALMAEHDLTEVDLKNGEETISLKRGQSIGNVVNHQPVIYNGAHGTPHAPGNPQAAPSFMHPQAGGPPSQPQAAAPIPSNLTPIESPMVGTLYLAANPDSPQFVKPGAQVGPDTVVCLIEAMKVFNEIKAEKSGTLEQILVKNGEAVEFGQKLFLIKAS